MVGRDPKVGRGTRNFNIEFYESPKIQTLEVGRDQIKFEIQLQSIAGVLKWWVDPKVGRGTRISNIRLYESSKIQTLEVGRDQIKFES